MPNSLGGPIFSSNNRGLYIIDRLASYPASQVVAASTLQLDSGSQNTWFFTGTTAGQIVRMPVATTVIDGQSYDFWNFSTQTIAIQDSTGTLLATLRANGRTIVIARDITTAAGVWALTYTLDNGNVFGTVLYYEDEDAETSNNSATTWANKVTLVTPSLPVGDYLVQYQFNWRAGNADRILEFRIQRAAADIDGGAPFTGSTSDRQLVSGFKRVQTISGVQTFTLDFRRGASSTTVYMYNARLFVWRIA